MLASAPRGRKMGPRPELTSAVPSAVRFRSGNWSVTDRKRWSGGEHPT